MTLPPTKKGRGDPVIVRERPIGAFELVGPHDVAVGLTPEQVARLASVRDPRTLVDVVAREPALRPIARAFRYFLAEEQDPEEGLRELAQSLDRRRAALSAPSPAPPPADVASGAAPLGAVALSGPETSR